MRLLLRSLHGGIAATVFLFTLLYYVRDRPALSRPLGEMLSWPWSLYDRLYTSDCPLCLGGLVVTLLCNLLTYSLLTYAVLRLAGRRNARRP
ncbi:MAG TPA: hypothetical protein VGV38_01455 [Pyrinomonadaceae bacterium]|nr:hypothetical protein [Pyrinomonadaceae bacterium]